MLDEATLSHLLRECNSFIPERKSYAGALCSFLEKSGALPDGASVLEIGPGLGNIALGLKDFMGIKARKYSYKALDISERILENMESMGFDTMLSDCLDVRTDEKFDLIIINEVASDLPTLVDYNVISEEEHAADAKRMIEQYGLDVPEYDFNFNYGAVRLIEILGSIVSPGGFVFLSEQGSGDGRPQKVPVIGHDEYTIDFSHLEKAARQNGFLVMRGEINHVLGIDEEKPFIAGLLRPDIKELYNLDRNDRNIRDIMSGIFTPDEFTSRLVDVGALNIYNIEKYGRFIRKEAKPIHELLKQFEFLLLRKK